MTFEIHKRLLKPEEIRVQCYNGVFDNAGVPVSLSAVLARIEKGGKGLREKTEWLRTLEPERYDREKISLPAVTFGGTFSKRARSELREHSGLMVLDIDGLSGEELAGVQAQLQAFPFVALCFVSPSGAGLKPVIVLDPMPRDDDEHEWAWRQVAAVLKAEGIVLDKSGKDVSRLCFLASDKNLFWRPVVEPFRWSEVSIGDAQQDKTPGDDNLVVKEVEEKPDKPAGDEKPDKPRRRRRAGAAVKRAREKGDKPGDREWRGPIDVGALRFVNPEDLEYHEWLEVGFAIKSAGLGVEVWDTWSQGDRARYKRGECQKKWKTFEAEGLVSWKRVFDLAVDAGYKSLPAGEAGSPLEIVRAVLGDRMFSIPKTPVMPGVKEFHFIPSDTGAGKTRAFLAIPDALLYIGMHGAGVDAAAEEARQLRRTVLRWRSRWHGFQEFYEECGGDRGKMTDRAFGVFAGVQNMCAFADRADVLAARGHSVEDNLCRNCPLNQTCWERGYLAQYREAVLAEVVCISLPEVQLLLDAAWASMARRLDRRVDDDDDGADDDAVRVLERIAGIDDATPWSLLVKRFVSFKMLDSMITSRSGIPIIENLMAAQGTLLPEDVAAFGLSLSEMFLSRLRDELQAALSAGGESRAVFEAFSDSVAVFKKEDGVWEQVVKELSKIPVFLIPRFSGGSWTVETRDGTSYPLVAAPGPGQFGFEVLGVEHRSEIKRDKLYRCFFSLGELVELGLAGYETQSAVEAIPAVSDAKHGWVSSLGNLIREAGCPENAPVSFNLLEARFEWAVSPHLNFKRTLYLSATAVEKHVKLAVAGLRSRVQLFSYSREPLAWMPGCCVYQLVDGKMTEQSFYIREAGKVIGPAARLADFVSVVLAQIQTGEKVLVVAREALRSEALKDVMSPLLAAEAAGKVSIINYSEMVGRNDFSECGAAFLTLPEPSPVELESVCRMLYRGDSKPLSFEREPGVLESCSVEVKMKMFVDDRVQEVYETLISHYLYQAAMRLRPALNGDKQIVLVTSFPVQGLSDRGAVLVSWESLLAAEGGDVRNAIEWRGEKEDVRDAVAAGDSVQEAAAKAGVSTRQGYRDTAELRREIKEQRDAWIRELHAAGKTQTEIADLVGMTQSQVSRRLKKIMHN